MNSEGNKSQDLHQVFRSPVEIRRYELGDELSTDTDTFVGLALSGGGIRSAAFALGVVQAFLDLCARQKKTFDRLFHYLSTVSGGGYLGSTLTWLKYKGLDLYEQLDGRSAGVRNRREKNWLDYVRQHGNYLKPSSISFLSLVSVVIRNIVFSLFVYVGVATLLFSVATNLEWLPDQPDAIIPLVSVTSIFIVFASAYGALILAYAVATFIRSFQPIHSVDLIQPQRVDNHGEETPSSNYQARLLFHQHVGTILGTIVVTGTLAAIPHVYFLLEDYLGSLAATSVSTLSTAVGGIGAYYQFTRGRGSVGGNTVLSESRLIVTAGLLIFGLLLGAYTLSLTFDAILQKYSAHYWGLAAFFLLGLLVNLNYFGIARMYRDRLMETFMPDSRAINESQWFPAFAADKTPISHFADIRPYHLINANIVLVDSGRDRFRSRGGDNFVISPECCGSEATGYVRTKSWLNDRMNLPTAVAISGAALNPHSGVSGRGITRNRLVSFLLALLQLRLGYWAPNTGFCGCEHRSVERFKKLVTRVFRANLWVPGLRQGLLGRGLHSRAIWSELTDGGHFDNTGLYELLRRELDVIVLSMASADPGFRFADLAELIRKVRVDFGTQITFKADQLESLVPDAKSNRSESHYAIGEISYASGKEGKLVVLAATRISGLTPEVRAYLQDNPKFPHEPTSDQFYDERQFEAYRELGYQIAKKFAEDHPDFPNLVGRGNKNGLEKRALRNAAS